MGRKLKLTIENEDKVIGTYSIDICKDAFEKMTARELEPVLLLKGLDGEKYTQIDFIKGIALTKGINDGGFRSTILPGQNPELRIHLKKAYSSDRFKELIDSICLAASTQMNVLLTGETGVGKEYIAKTIHSFGKWADKPFVAVNCGAIPENLLESELFGYDEGAFTGAKRSGKPGKFELAGEGIIFLDEISDMPVNLQVKLLRVLQERQFERVGGIKPIKMNAKIITATNRNLEQAIQQNLFRLDLYYRISVLKINLPPLREHKEDIIGIANECLERINSNYSLNVTELSDEAAEILKEEDWTGNVRELGNILEFAANVAVEGKILPVHLPNRKDPGLTNKTSLNSKLEDMEKGEILRALKESGGSRIKASELLSMSRSTFYNKLNKYGIE